MLHRKTRNVGAERETEGILRKKREKEGQRTEWDGDYWEGEEQRTVALEDTDRA